jgi:predicted DNA-binding protein
MGTLGLKIPDELEERFRRAVFESKGMKKGNITESLEEAIELWIDEVEKAEKGKSKK